MKILYKQSRLVIVVFLVSFLSRGQTNFSAVYTFGTQTNVSSFEYNGTNYSGIVVNAITKNGATSSQNQYNFRANNWTNGATTGSDIFTGQVNLGQYFEFSFTPSIGYEYTITSINFGIGRSANGTRQSQWRGSVDSYASVLDNYSNLSSGLTNNTGILTNLDTDSSWIGTKLTLGTNYTNLSNTTIFRYYLYNAEAGTGTAGLQGPLTITGTITVVFTRWDGTQWNNGAPTAAVDAFIDGDYTTGTNGIFTSKNITINAGNTLTISPTNELNFSGSLLNNGAIIVDQNSKLIQSE